MTLEQLANQLIDQLPLGWRFDSYQLCTADEYVVRVVVDAGRQFDVSLRPAR